MPRRQVQANGIEKETKMPEVMGKHFAYNKAGYRAAARAKKRLGKKNYSSDAIKMARKMYG